MREDARFEDGDDRPLRLRALDPEDLSVVASLVQDAVFPITDMSWSREKRRFSILINRFRWEVAAPGLAPERVRAVVAIEDVAAVRSQGIDRSDPETVLSLLSMGWDPADDGTGRITLVLAGDGAIEVQVEALEVILRDVTRPFVAPSGQIPSHPE